MKKILLILTIALVALSSCKKEDEVTTTNCGVIASVNPTDSQGKYLVYWENYDGTGKTGFYLDDNGDKLSAGDNYCK